MAIQPQLLRPSSRPSGRHPSRTVWEPVRTIRGASGDRALDRPVTVSETVRRVVIADGRITVDVPSGTADGPRPNHHAPSFVSGNRVDQPDCSLWSGLMARTPITHPEEADTRRGDRHDRSCWSGGRLHHFRARRRGRLTTNDYIAMQEQHELRSFNQYRAIPNSAEG